MAQRPAPPPRLALRLDEIALSLGISSRTIQRMVSAGEFPKPTAKAGTVPLWSTEVVREWAAGRA